MCHIRWRAEGCTFEEGVSVESLEEDGVRGRGPELEASSWRPRESANPIGTAKGPRHRPTVGS